MKVDRTPAKGSRHVDSESESVPSPVFVASEAAAGILRRVRPPPSRASPRATSEPSLCSSLMTFPFHAAHRSGGICSVSFKSDLIFLLRLIETYKKEFFDGRPIFFTVVTIFQMVVKMFKKINAVVKIFKTINCRYDFFTFRANECVVFTYNVYIFKLSIIPQKWSSVLWYTIPSALFLWYTIPSVTSLC